MYQTAKAFARFVASGAIAAADTKKNLKGIKINALSGDSTVSLYDAQGTTVAQRFYSSHQQPGVALPFEPLCYLIRDGGYVEITGSAEVFLYFS